MNFLQKILDGKIDEDIHHKFTRFGKGEFNRFLLMIKKGKNLRIKTSYDLANMLVEMIAYNIEEDAEVQGKIFANYDFENDMPCEVEKYSKRGKIYTAELKTTLSPEKLKELYEKFKSHYMLLIIKSSKFKMKSGKTLPKPGKDPKEDFCSATLPVELLKELAFDFDDDFTEAKIRHTLFIEDIEIPDEFKDDPAQARLKGIRKGKIERVIEFDGKEIKKEYKLAA